MSEDNSGSFDTLIPLLPENVEFLTVDFPGHGMSSHLPDGLFYYGMDGIIVIRRLQRYFGWSKMSLMGHSLGGIMSFMFACTYPESVDLLVCLDGFRPVYMPSIEEKRAKYIDDFIKYDMVRNFNSKNRPSYTIEALTQIWHEGSRKSVDVDKCIHILNRHMSPSLEDPSKYYLTLDPRLKTGPLYNSPQEEMLKAAERLVMPVLLSKASQTPRFWEQKVYLEVLEVIKKFSSDFRFHEIEGTHHVHLNNPERLQHFISDFVTKHYANEELLLNFKEGNKVI